MIDHSEDVFEFHTDGEELKERFELSFWRISNLEYDVDERARDYFSWAASLITDPKEEFPFKAEELSWADRSRAAGSFGEELGLYMSIWALELSGYPSLSRKRNLSAMASMLETFIQIYNEFEIAYADGGSGLPDAPSVRDIIYSYLFDYTEELLSDPEDHKMFGLLLCPDPKVSDPRLRDLLMEHRDDLAYFLGDRLSARIREAAQKLRPDRIGCRSDQQEGAASIPLAQPDGGACDRTRSGPVPKEHSINLVNRLRDYLDKYNERI